MAKGIDASEIARLAGVSRATVSRVINEYAYVKRATRERVLKIIKEHAYSPHFSAQILAGKRSNTIGLFLSMGPSYKSRLEDTHVNFMIRRVIYTAMAAGYYVLVSQVADLENPAMMKRIGDMFSQSRIDGGIFINFPNECGLLEDLIARGYPVGSFDHYLPQKQEPNRVIVRLDHSEQGIMVRYAAGMGFKRLMYVGDPMKAQSGVDVFQRYREAMEAAGLELKDGYILKTHNLSTDAAIEVMDPFLESGLPLPECILCGNDVVAFGVIESLRKKNIAVPDDISVIGSDDILVGQYFNPPLTTVHYDFEEMLEALTSKVIACVEHPFNKQYEGVWTGTIVERSSCRPPRK